MPTKSAQPHTSRWFREFGKALEPPVLKTSGFALLVGFVGGLVAQGLLEFIYLFTNIFILATRARFCQRIYDSGQ